MQGGTARHNLKCAQLRTRGGICQQGLVQRCMLSANCCIASPLGITLDMRMSLSSKRRSVWNKSQRKEKDPDLVRLSTRSPGSVGIPSKIPAAEAGGVAGASCGGRGSCGREEEDGREEGANKRLFVQKKKNVKNKPHCVEILIMCS